MARLRGRSAAGSEGGSFWNPRSTARSNALANGAVALLQRFSEVVLGVAFGFELVDLVAPGNPISAGLTCEQLEVGPVDKALDSPILLIGLLGMLAPRRNDQLAHIVGLDRGPAAPPEQTILGVLSGREPGAHVPADTGGILLRPREGLARVPEAPALDELESERKVRARYPEKQPGIGSGNGAHWQRRDLPERHDLVMPRGRPSLTALGIGGVLPRRIGQDGAEVFARQITEWSLVRHSAALKCVRPTLASCPTASSGGGRETSRCRRAVCHCAAAAVARLHPGHDHHSARRRIPPRPCSCAPPHTGRPACAVGATPFPG